MTAPLLQLYFGAAGSDDRHEPARALSDAPLAASAVYEGDVAALALADRVRAGDAAAFDQLVATYLTTLVRFAAYVVRSRESAEDVVQEVFARLWARPERLPRRGSVRAFLFAAVRNRALDELKHLRADDRALHTFASFAADARAERDEAGETQVGDTQALLARVDAVMRSLPERQQTALSLRYGQSLRVAEVAAVLGVSVKAAEQLLVRAMRALRGAVGEAPE